MRAHRFAVQASVSAAGAPQAAVVGVVVTEAFELFFDTLDSSRKVANLRANPRIAFVIGGTASVETVQYEGVVVEPTPAELQQLKALYFSVFPDGREREQWAGITYVRVTPRWLRYSDYGQQPAEIAELEFAAPPSS
jgi:general stress protein 26